MGRAKRIRSTTSPTSRRFVLIDKGQLVERVGKVTARKLALVLAGIDLVLGR